MADSRTVENGNTQTPSSDVPVSAKPRRPLTWKMRIALVSFGTLAGLVLFEVLLRAFGFVYYFERQHRPGNHPEDAYVILCVGDSCTWGLGTDQKRYGYPVQLANLLAKRHPETKSRVVNMGFPGANSSQINRRFEGWLRLHDPDLCIILIGNNDVWNQNESFLYLVGEGEDAKFSRRLQTRLRIWGDSLRVVRLLRCAILLFDDDREKAHKWNPDEDTNPSDHNFREGMKILGDIENIRKLYRMNFRGISRIAEQHGVKMLWLDYHLPAKFGETDYIGPVLEELGATYVDLGPYFHEGDKIKRELIENNPWHPNQLGYTLFTRVIYNKLAELGHVPGPPLENVQDNLIPYD